MSIISLRLSNIFTFQPFSGHGGKLVEALGEYHQSSLSQKKENLTSPAFLYAQDALYCFRRHFSDWERKPDDMERFVIASSPIESPKVQFLI